MTFHSAQRRAPLTPRLAPQADAVDALYVDVPAEWIWLAGVLEVPLSTGKPRPEHRPARAIDDVATYADFAVVRVVNSTREQLR